MVLLPFSYSESIPLFIILLEKQKKRTRKNGGSIMDFGIWFLMGAALVFFMQCGFAMVETGFTRAKSAGNIIMKNLMDFCIGTIMYIFLGFGLMMSEDYVAGVIGIPNLGIFTDFANFDYSNFVFQLVFCATAATIVSGAMAERTKFSAYCIYSALLSAVVYPIEAGWVWNSQGWLAQLGFVDFAGSTVIHMVGGTAALIGAIIVGPRIGKYTKRKNGEVKVNAIPGHSLTLGALGCFILWFGWYGFNGAAATTISSLGSIFLTTTIAPAVATVVCMIFTWVKNGKPDVGMCMNASLAGLVAITAPCASVDALGAIIIGAVAGILVDVVVEFLDQKLHIDDPVGAVGVHMANGIWGTLAVGLFATGKGDTVEAFADGSSMAGLFYGGGFKLLGIQFLGCVSILAYVAICMIVVFQVIKHTIGLRASEEDELQGMDIAEHGLASAYADFLPIAPAYMGESVGSADLTGLEPAKLSIGGTQGEGKYTKITIICSEEKFSVLRDTMAEIGVTGMTVVQAMGCGVEQGKSGRYRGVHMSMNLRPKVKVEIVVSTVDPNLVVAAARRALYTGKVGDGKIFVSDVEDIMRVRTGDTGYDALVNE
jgi:Amt family ammonium transporter